MRIVTVSCAEPEKDGLAPTNALRRAQVEMMKRTMLALSLLLG
jgi:hypothetical protein